jgi:hypothetical protein
MMSRCTGVVETSSFVEELFSVFHGSIIGALCQAWLKADERNVAVIHCKAGFRL